MIVKDLRRKSKKRVDVRYIQSLGVQSFGDDNLYPQFLKQLISGSGTAAECVGRYADFIEGNGFREITFSEYVVNRRGDTADDIHALICQDMAYYDGIALHVNYNMLGEIVELNYVPFENCRLQEEDDNGYVEKIAVHPDWSGNKTRNGKTLKVNKNTIDYIDVFNPDKNVVIAQIEAAGGIEYYKGQVMWISGLGRNIYPSSRADRVVTEISTDEGLSNVKYRNVRNNFLPAGMMITKKASNPIEIDENGKEIIQDNQEDTGFSDTLVKFQGDTNVGKIMEVVLNCDEEKPEFVQLKTNNYDKEFTVTDASTVERIYSAFGQEPWYCIRIGKVGFSGDILEDAFEYYNSIVNRQQRMIERALQKVFTYWHETVNPTFNFSVQPLKYIRNAAEPTNNNE